MRWLVAAGSGGGPNTGGVPLWLWVLLPTAGLVLAAGMFYFAFRSNRREQSHEREAREKRDRRLEAAADAVLGRPADWTAGQPEVKGLVQVVKEQGGQLNKMESVLGSPNGKSLIDMVAHSHETLEQMGHGQAILSERLEEHTRHDDERFDRLEHTIRNQR